MAPFYPLFIRRSDGTTEVRSKSTRESNQPTDAQLNNKPNAQGISDFYRECPVGDAKEVDWRRKLGGMLMREIGGKEAQGRLHILAAMPEGYRLFEHVKCRFSDIDGQPQKVTKNHAAGANERQDAYLYGHPSGRKKRYRSPAEYFPHLLWLATDEAGDTNNCSCKFCSPEEVDEKEPTPRAITMQKDTTSLLVPPPPPIRRTSQIGSQTPQPQAQAPQPKPLPRHRTIEQKMDSQYNQFLYRPGEVVWFSRGQAWGLGVLKERSTSQSYSGRQYQYRIQPLSHPIRHPQTVTCQQDHLRPWLAWSPPPCTCAILNSSSGNPNRSVSFETVDWEAYLGGRYGQGDPEVDGSILAAKAVETTFTLFDRIESKTSTFGASQTSEIYYNGIFFGGEKMWLGEPLRLRNPISPSDIVILHAIIERPQPSDPTHPQISLIGDTFSLQSLPASTTSPKTSLYEQYLPLRVREDLHQRNTITAHSSTPSTRHYSWNLLTPSTTFSLSDLKGRWYESTIFVPIMDSAAYTSGLAKGELPDAGLWMNGQGDCNRPIDSGTGTRGFRAADTKVRRREDAFGRAVPDGFAIVSEDDGKVEARAGRGQIRGAEGEEPGRTVKNGSQQQPQQQQQQGMGGHVVHRQIGPDTTNVQQQPYSATDGAFDVDQYMKFDDDEGVDAQDDAFGQEFDTQDLDGHFFGADHMQH